MSGLCYPSMAGSTKCPGAATCKPNALSLNEKGGRKTFEQQTQAHLCILLSCKRAPHARNRWLPIGCLPPNAASALAPSCARPARRDQRKPGRAALRFAPHRGQRGGRARAAHNARGFAAHPARWPRLASQGAEVFSCQVQADLEYCLSTFSLASSKHISDYLPA